MKNKNPTTTCIKNDLLKLVYATMLRELPHSIVKKFWISTPLIINGIKMPLVDQLKHIWDEKKQTEFLYTLKIINALEPFFVENGIKAVPFIDKVITGLNRGSLLPPPVALGYIAPFLKFILHTEDLRCFCLKNLIPFVLEKVFPPIYCKTVKHAQVNDLNNTVLTICFDTTFKKTVLPYNIGLFIDRPLKFSPMRLGLPPFEEVRVLSDVNPVQNIVDKKYLSMHKDGAYVGKKRIGSYVGFLEFCQKNAIEFNGIAVPDSNLLQIEEDYYCPIRKRVVLFKGCIYGAPLYLLEVVYKAQVAHSDQCIASVINDSLNGPTDLWQFAQELHGQMMADLERKIVFVYNKTDKVLKANGEKIVRSTPANIMRVILKEYLASGKTVFSNTDFTENRKWVKKNMTDNFPVRLQRLTQVLLEKLPEVGIIKTDRGRFRLAVKCKLEYREE